jgi:NAD(P)H dehydrogenase (quinone)
MKGYVDRVLGSGVTAEQIQHGGAATLMKDKRLLSITSSGASAAWFKKQAQIESLRNIFGRYLATAFEMKSYDQLHFVETAEGLSQDFIDPLLDRTQDFAAEVCASVSEDPSVVLPMRA